MAKRKRKAQGKRAMQQQWSVHEAKVAVAEPQEDPRAVVLDARARLNGFGAPSVAQIAREYAAPKAKMIGPVLPPEGKIKAKHREVTDIARRRADDPMFCEQAGIAIRIGAEDNDEASKLWSLFKAADAADEAYARRFVGIRRFPNVGKLEYLPETFETRADDKPDHRTQDEKDRDAVNAWMRWQGHFGCLDRDHHTVIVDAMRHRARLTHAGQLTRTGAAFIAAMRALDMVTQRR